MNRERLRARLARDVDRLRAPEGYLRAGSPRYFTLFGRDSLISAWQTLRYDPRIAESTLRMLASYQGRRTDARSEEEPGKILHEHRFDPASQNELPDWGFPYYGSVDSTLLFLIVADEYERHTGDKRLATDLWPAFLAAHRWMDVHGDLDGDGFIEYERKNPHGLFHQGWKDGSADHLRIEPPVAMVEVQGYAVRAHRAFAALAEVNDQGQLAREARAQATRLADALNRIFWMPDVGYYALALDGRKRLRTAIASNPGHLPLIGVVPKDRMALLVSRLFQDDMWTPYGIRTHATSEPDFDAYGYHMGTVWPHDNWFLYRGLTATGFQREAGRVRDALLRAYEELDGMPELYAVVDDRIIALSAEPKQGTRANPIQAWSTGALIDLLDDAEPASP